MALPEYSPFDIRPCRAYVPDGSYLPEQLGLYMEGVYAINVGVCTSYPDVPTSDAQLAGSYQFAGVFAHAHPDVGVICFPDGTHIFSEPGVPDNVLIHEYCHILRGMPPDPTKDHHDEEWGYYMTCYGLDPDKRTDYVYR